MADEAMSAVPPKAQILVVGGAPGAMIGVKVGDADEKPGHIVTGTGETYARLASYQGTAMGTVDLCAETEVPLGVLERRADLDIDTAVTAANGAKGVPCIRKGFGSVVKMFLQANSGDGNAGDALVPDTEAGKCQAFDYADATNKSDTLMFLVGFLLHNHTNDASDDKIIYGVI